MHVFCVTFSILSAPFSSMLGWNVTTLSAGKYAIWLTQTYAPLFVNISFQKWKKMPEIYSKCWPLSAFHNDLFHYGNNVNANRQAPSTDIQKYLTAYGCSVSNVRQQQTKTMIGMKQDQCYHKGCWRDVAAIQWDKTGFVHQIAWENSVENLNVFVCQRHVTVVIPIPVCVVVGKWSLMKELYVAV